jgi:nucleotide-binding universal stress UspA family protein
MSPAARNRLHELFLAGLSRVFLRADVRLAGAAPPQLIAAEAGRRSADYIVVGSHGHTALYELLVGCTTGGVPKKARCPVTVIPARHSTSADSDKAAPARPKNA